MNGAGAPLLDAHASRTTLHATALVVGEAALLLRGPSGVGKTALALALIEDARRAGFFARLIADDRTTVRNAGGRLIASPHPLIAGRVERRFRGVGPIVHEAAGIVRLIVDLFPHFDSPGVDRLPADAGFVTVAGVRVPRLAVPANHPGSIGTILHALGETCR